MIVSDSTTLIILSNFKRFELLSNLFSQIIIPQAVYEELNAKVKTTLPPFIKVQKVNPSQLLNELKLLLDLGESEAIALAIELNSKLIIDERRGRKVAMNMGITITGLLGIVYLNIKKSFISKTQAKEFLDSAIADGYRISHLLVEDMFRKIDIQC